MTAILEAEATRLREQQRLDQLRLRKSGTSGGNLQPRRSSLWISPIMRGTKLKRRKGRFSFLDPAIGTGSFFGAFLPSVPA